MKPNSRTSVPTSMPCRPTSRPWTNCRAQSRWPNRSSLTSNVAWISALPRRTWRHSSTWVDGSHRRHESAEGGSSEDLPEEVSRSRMLRRTEHLIGRTFLDYDPAIHEYGV